MIFQALPICKLVKNKGEVRFERNIRKRYVRFLFDPSVNNTRKKEAKRMLYFLFLVPVVGGLYVAL